MNALKSFRKPLLCLIAFVTIRICSALQLPVEIGSLPTSADSVFLLANADELVAPLAAFARLPKGAPTIGLLLPSSSTRLLTIRAAAFAGTSVFPIVTAIGSATYKTGQEPPVRITMNWPTPRIEMSAETANSRALLVTFGETDFFRDGDVAELWISDSMVARNCTGIHYLTPFFTVGAVWKAQFIVPADLISPVTSIQLAFRALDLRVGGRVPLLVWPNRDVNEPALQIESRHDLHSSDPSLSAPRPSAVDGGQNRTMPAPTPYVVKLGPDGRLIRLPIGKLKAATKATK
jgi:hypothetical protein